MRDRALEVYLGEEDFDNKEAKLTRDRAKNQRATEIVQQKSLTIRFS